MGHRYEYRVEDCDPLSVGDFSVGRDVFGADMRVVVCTIYDEDTDEELAEGVGNSEDDARLEAERNL